MKQFFTTILAIMVIAAFSVNIQAQRVCASHDILMEQMKENPEMAKNLENIEQFTKSFVQNPLKLGTTDVITIPVVVHVIYNTTQQNISDAQIQSQIAVLNEDFRKLNADASKTPSTYAGLATDVLIQFKLATVDPTGKATTGITRKYSSKTSWGTRDAMKKTKQGGVNPWDATKYLNLWVCNIGGGILGYAQFPGGSTATDGVVIGPNYFGSSKKGTGFYLSAPYDLGRTATHEVGHWLNLRHIWGDGGCTMDDYVTDTPDDDAANYGCPTWGLKACNNLNAMWMNYMDYTDDACMYMFTVGQKDRMRALFATGGARAAMVTNNPAAVAVNNDNATVNSVKTTDAKEFEVFPNPANGVINVTLYNFESNANVRIIDMTGKVVKSISELDTDTEINISDLNTGFYFISVGDDQGVVTKRFIKNE